MVNCVGIGKQKKNAGCVFGGPGGVCFVLCIVVVKWPGLFPTRLGGVGFSIYS